VSGFVHFGEPPLRKHRQLTRMHMAILIDSDQSPEYAQNYREIMYAFAFSAALAFVAILIRLGRNGVWFTKRPNPYHWSIHLQAAIAPFTLLFEVAMAFPHDYNLFDVTGKAFQTVMLPEGQALLDLNLERILAGAAASAIICIGAFICRDLNVHAGHTAAHIIIGFAFLHLAKAKSKTGSGGTFEIPSILHFGCALANGLNYARSYRRRIVEILQGDVPAAATRLKQE